MRTWSVRAWKGDMIMVVVVREARLLEKGPSGESRDGCDVMQPLARRVWSEGEVTRTGVGYVLRVVRIAIKAIKSDEES